MRKLIRSVGVFLFMVGITAHAQTITPQAEQRAKDIVTKMTLQEKIEYISGYTSFSLRAIPRLGIPEIKLADGPQGIRNHAPKSTLYPSGILSASTWNRELLYKLGQGLGQDAKARGVNILLGPGVNIYRAPLCGRNFEYFGEDPYLTGETAKQYILGVQSEGVIATIKHFAANNQEWSRHHASSDIDERTLQEIYFPAFRKAVQEANVGAVMNSYNLLNGVHATEHKWLNIDVLRNLWGFKGILMSDWTSVYSAVGAANAGLDLEMPKGRFMNLENLLPAIKAGTVTEETINLKVQHILQTLIAYGMLDKEQKDSNIAEDNPFSRQTALELAREGVVLLKNEGDLLPLKGKTAVMVALSFATFENICYLIQNGAGHFSFIFFRGIGTGAMHVICGAIVGGGLAYVWQRTWLKIAGTCGLLGAAITLHAIYNLLIAYGGAVQYTAYLLPVVILAAGKLIARRLTP